MSGSRATFRSSLQAGAGRALTGLLVPAAAVLVWQYLATIGVFKPWQMPAPTSIWWTLVDMTGTGVLYEHIAITLQRMALGFLIGSVAALVIGSVVGFYRLLERLLDPTVQALRSIPSFAWVPLLLLWMGIGEAPKVILIGIGVFFPVYLNLVSGIHGVSRKLVEVGEIYGLKGLELIRRVILPAALPSFLVGLRSGLGLGWMFVVAAEMLAASSGLGFLLTDGREMTRPDVVIASILLFAQMGKLTDAALKLAQNRLLYWQESIRVEG